jgi:hypothetical protein
MRGGRLWPVAAVVLVALAPSLVAACDPPPADRLPDLRMDRLTDLSIETTGDGRKLLRFTTVIVNVGTGPFELHGSRTAGDPTMGVDQRVHDSAGGSRDVGTAASMYYSGDGHDHWHVRDLETYELSRWDGPVGSGAKHGFCFRDDVPFRTSLPFAPTFPVYRGCGGAGDTTVEAGLSVGWGDRYAATLVDQYIDVTDVGPGSYRLTATADAEDWFLESDDGNNDTWVDLRIGRREVAVTGYGPSA